jgi:hypothetical protein
MKVIPLINKTLEEKSPRGVKKKRSYFYISEAGKTPFEIFKSMTGYDYVSHRMQRVFDNGNDVHERIIGYLIRQGVVAAREVRMRTRLFRGRADAIIFADGRIAVLEVKSMKKEDFQKLKKYGSRKAYLQLQLYLHFLGIDDGIILVECKDDQRIKEFHIKRKFRVAQELITQFTRLKRKFVEGGVMAA